MSTSKQKIIFVVYKNMGRRWYRIVVSLVSACAEKNMEYLLAHKQKAHGIFVSLCQCMIRSI
jgi:hypothetical protein